MPTVVTRSPQLNRTSAEDGDVPDFSPQEAPPLMKALVGSWDHRPYRLLAENTALRTRVAELEQALQALSRENDALRAELEQGSALEVAVASR